MDLQTPIFDVPIPGLKVVMMVMMRCVAVPAPPSLYTKVLQSSIVHTTWEASAKMGQHQGFRLFYRRAHAPLFIGPLNFPRNVTQYNITQLGETCFFSFISISTTLFKSFFKELAKIPTWICHIVKRLFGPKLKRETSFWAMERQICGNLYSCEWLVLDFEMGGCIDGWIES